jgi:pyruvate/2-oxoglutarate dehydrogenase complex dihydrolipoamide acyltransferase (E2) component
VDLSPGQRRAVFALVVIVLAALGYYLIVPALRHSGGQAQAATSSAPASATPAASAPAPAVTAPATAPATAAGSVNIYSWLPFTQQDLAAAASVAARFSVDYNTFTYTESASAYTSGMGGLITGQLASTLQAAYQTPGVAKLRTSQKQVSTGTAAISSLRAFGSGSLTFVVNAGQRLVTSNGTTNGSTQYAVTVTGSGTSWQVNDIELASAGNE